MKIFRSLILLNIIFVLLACSEDKDTVTQPEIHDGFPKFNEFISNTIGHESQFIIDTLNATSQTFDNLGFRISKVLGNSLDGTNQTISVHETYNLNNQTFEINTNARITESALEFYVDTTGISELIPDNLEFDLTMINDEYIKLVVSDYNNNLEWNSYSAKVKYGSFSFNVLSMTGKYVGKEELTLDGQSESLTCEKFEYKITLNIPDMSNLLASNIQTYSAKAWLSTTQGIVKLEGCSIFVDPIGGKRFELADSACITRHTQIP